MSKIIDLVILVFLSFVIFSIFSPHNLLNFTDFISSITYESDVALGRSLVFYTRQFFETQPLYFQFEKVFPYVLGWPVFILSIFGFIFGNWKDKKINLLRFSFLIYFIPSVIIYAKWSRFMAPILPIMTIFAILIISNIKDQISKLSSKFKVLSFALGFALCVLIFAMIIPGVAYLSIYEKPDVRFHASRWIYKNIPNNSYILSETANVVDIPTINETVGQSSNYSVISFNFYDLDIGLELQEELKNHIVKADYIFMPSRRILANHTCFRGASKNRCLKLQKTYPLINQYYEDLLSGKLGFVKVAEFNSFPEIKFEVLGYKFRYDFPDEQAEETWTVFDHPVIRIYKKIKS